MFKSMSKRTTFPFLAAVIALSIGTASAENRGIYSTSTRSTTTSSTNASTGVTTATTVGESTTSRTGDDRSIYSSRDRDNRRSTDNYDDSRDRFRNGDTNFTSRSRNDQDRDGRTSDIEARYPYDNTGGRNRSDVDAARSGFDDPRNPWDGRYVNDNPRNSADLPGANASVSAMRGNENYRPGAYGTRSLRNRGRY